MSDIYDYLILKRQDLIKSILCQFLLCRLTLILLPFNLLFILLQFNLLFIFFQFKKLEKAKV